MSALGCFLCIVTTIAAVFIPESPRLLVAQGKVEEVQKSINFMARVNRKTVEWTAEELQWIAENSSAANSSKKPGVIVPLFMGNDMILSAQ